MTGILLGLIGDNIAASRAPELHRICGDLAGLELRYDLFIPKRMAMDFDEAFDHVAARGCRGVNITLPYKARVVPRVTIADPATARLGAVNTVRFGPDGPEGFNTDHSGFIAAYRAAFGEAPPGRVALIGAGGVGRALGFALVTLGAAELVVIERDSAAATALTDALNTVQGAATQVRIGGLADLTDADGVCNCTPLGMHGYPGSPVPEGAFPTGGWAFDAVYTPMDTPFRAQAEAAGAAFLSGYELFFHQGVHAFEIFTGLAVADPDGLRARLAAAEQERT